MSWPIPRIKGSVTAWALQNPDAVNDIIDFLNALHEESTVKITSPSGPASAGTPIRVTRNGITVEVPLKFSTTIFPPSGGGTVDVQARASISQLLAAFTQIGQNP